MKRIIESFLQFTISIVFICSACSSGLTQSPDARDVWPQFRGNNASGIAFKDAQPPIEFGEGQNQLWRIELPEGHSSPIIYKDNLIVTGCIEQNNELQTMCINRNQGNIKWIQSVTPDTLDGYHAVGNPAQSTAYIDSTGVYTYFGSYGLIRYSLEGEPIWEKKLPRSLHRWGTAASPLIKGRLLILNRDNQKDGRYLLALNKLTGESIWRTELEEYGNSLNPTSWSTPVIWRDKIILHRFGGVDMFSLNDGSLISNLQFLTTGVSTPIVSDQLFYVCTWHNLSEKDNRGDLPRYKEYATLLSDFDSNSDGVIDVKELPKDLYVQIRPEIKDLPGSKGSFRGFSGWMDKDQDKLISKKEWDEFISFGESWYVDAGLIAIKPNELNKIDVLWQQSQKISEVPSPLLYQDRIYMIKDGGTLTCMNAHNGSIHFREKIGVSGPYFASPVAANGFIYIAANNGKIVVIRSSEDLEVVKTNDIGDRIFATPSIVDNCIYIRSKIIYLRLTII